MNRRLFLAALPLVVLGAELVVPKRTYFLPPYGGWLDARPVWAVKAEGGYFFSHQLSELLHNRAYDKYPIISVRDRNFLTPLGDCSHGTLHCRRWSGDLRKPALELADGGRSRSTCP